MINRKMISLILVKYFLIKISILPKSYTKIINDFDKALQVAIEMSQNDNDKDGNQVKYMV